MDFTSNSIINICAKHYMHNRDNMSCRCDPSVISKCAISYTEITQFNASSLPAHLAPRK